MLFDIIAAVVFPPYGTYKLVEWLIGNGSTRRTTKQQIQKPTSEANCLFPVMWGTVDIKSPVLGWCGDFSKVGITYRATAVFHLCHGIIDDLISISWDSKIASTLETLSIDYPGYYLQYQPDLFGAGDGVSGRFIYYKGGKTDEINEYVDSIDDELTQAYRGIATVVMEDNYLGNSPALHNPSFRVCRYFRDVYSEIPFPNMDDYVVTNETVTFIAKTDVWSFTTSGKERIWQRAVTLTQVTNLKLKLNFNNSNPFSENTGVKVYATLTGATERGPRIWPIGNNPGADNYHAFDFGFEENINASELSIANYTIEVVMIDWDDDPLTVSLVDGEFFARGTIEITGAAILKDILTNKEYGCGIDKTNLHSSFLDASKQLASDKFGLSMSWEGDEKREDFINRVLAHIDGKFVEDRSTGKLKLKLVRKIVDSSGLFVINNTNCISVKSPSRPELYESPNCVTVNFYSLEKTSEDSVTVENQVLIEAMGGNRVEVSFDFKGISRRDLAQRVALRELNAIVAQPFSCILECDSTCMFLEQTDAFVLDWPDYLTEQTAMRVVEMDFGDGTTNRVIIQAIQDVFDLPALSLSGKA